MSWSQSLVSHMYPWPIGVLLTASAVSFVFGAIGVWSLWRVKTLLAVVPVVQDRLDSLSNSVTLLTDTTESCFKALAMQLQFMQSQQGIATAPASRGRATSVNDAGLDAGAKKSRQRRVVGAARRGDGVAAIAAREDLAEAEVSLRLHLNNQQGAQTPEGKRYGTLLS